MIRGIILDWGGVVCEDPSLGFIRYCSKELGVSADILSQAVSMYLGDFMKGLPEEEFWGHVAKQVGIQAPSRPLWREALAAVYVPLEPTIETARKLQRQGIRIGLLTNTEPPSRDFHLSLGYDFFWGRVFSCDEGLSKPDPKIYALAAERLGLRLEECLMVDDRAENIRGAEQAGMPAHLFVSQGLFEKALTEYGIL
jgi:putative hydrolase of the HAD superfamily